MATIILLAIMAIAYALRDRAFLAPVAPLTAQLNILGAILGAAAPVVAGLIGNRQAAGDRRRSRQLTEQAIRAGQRGARGATQQFGLNAPLRDAFRFGALNMGGTPTARSNPFSQDLFGGFAQFLQRETGPQGVGTGFERPPENAGSRAASSQADRLREMMGGNSLMNRALGQAADKADALGARARFARPSFQVGAPRFAQPQQQGGRSGGIFEQLAGRQARPNGRGGGSSLMRALGF